MKEGVHAYIPHAYIPPNGYTYIHLCAYAYTHTCVRACIRGKFYFINCCTWYLSLLRGERWGGEEGGGGTASRTQQLLAEARSIVVQHTVTCLPVSTWRLSHQLLLLLLLLLHNHHHHHRVVVVVGGGGGGGGDFRILNIKHRKTHARTHTRI